MNTVPGIVHCTLYTALYCTLYLALAMQEWDRNEKVGYMDLPDVPCAAR